MFLNVKKIAVFLKLHVLSTVHIPTIYNDQVRQPSWVQ